MFVNSNHLRRRVNEVKIALPQMFGLYKKDNFLNYIQRVKGQMPYVSLSFKHSLYNCIFENRPVITSIMVSLKHDV
jgi:hypothetical protein